MKERPRLHEAKLEALRRLIQEGIDSGPAVALDMDAIREALKRRASRIASSQT